MTQTNVVFQGLAASSGIALGYVHLLDRERMIVPRRHIESKEVEQEILRFNSSLEKIREKFRLIRQKINEEDGEDHSYLIEAQLLMLEDRSMIDGTRDYIREDQINAEWALQRSLERFKRLFDRVDDEYFRDRRSDIEYVEERLLRLLSGSREQEYVSLHRKSILVARDLSPADITRVSRDNLVGIVTDSGGRTSHVAIMARSIGIPAVASLGVVVTEAKNGDRLIVDGSQGKVILRPEKDTWAEYEEIQKRYLLLRKELLKNRHHKAETKDQCEIRLVANVDLPEEVPEVLSNGALGIGMLRTENVFLESSIPVSEEEQFECYKTIVSTLKSRETVIRLFDLGGGSLFEDSSLYPRLDRNPALGLRGIRLLLRHPDILRTQIRAILRASAFGKVAILYPLVSGVGEVRQANLVLREVMEELRMEEVEFDADFRIGSMIEVPSAALTANRFAQEVDFISIGTNDLIQYTLGVDRANELVAELYDPFHGAVIQLLKKIVDLGHQSAMEVGVCGEMAAEPLFVPLLVGLELNFLSVNSNSIPFVKQIIRETNMSEAKEWVETICTLDDPTEIKQHLSEYYSKHYSGLFS